MRGVTRSHRLHVLPWLRAIGGRVLIPGWLAMTVGRDIVSWRPLSPAELAHELEHVRQWDRYGIRFVARYGRASWRAAQAGGHWYRDNAFEVAARAAAARTSADPAPSAVASAQDGHPHA